MPNIKSAKKRVRVNAAKRANNISTKSTIKTQVKKYENAAQAGDKETAATMYSKISSMLDKAAAKGIIHRNTAARRKSRLAAKL